MAYYILKSYKLRFKPFRIFEALSRKKQCFFLDSSLNPALSRKGGVNNNYSSGRPACRLGRYSFLGIEPFYILKTKNQDPFPKLKEALGCYKISLPKTDLPFLGGAVGYLAYDLGLTLEKKIKTHPKEESRIPDCFFGFYNAAVLIDHSRQLLYIFSAGFPEKKYHLAKALAETNFKKIYRALSNINADKSSIQAGKLKDSPAALNSNFSKEQYLLAIKRAKEYIARGDIYQLNLSQRFQAKTGFSAFEIYRRLRRINPSYFSAYFDAGDFQILSSSPERFLKLDGDLVVTRPMKGTRRRGKDKLEDRALKRELWQSAKDKAELLMIVDLERNDLGRVCDYGSIKVKPQRELEEYSTVFQTTATVEGRLHRDKDRINLLAACFPGGSITGCPKIRAMELIEELEPHRRSIYTGCFGYLSFSGNMDFSILIRAILKEQNKIYFGAGGGIVADSKPEDEYQETLVKASGMIEAVG